MAVTGVSHISSTPIPSTGSRLATTGGQDNSFLELIKEKLQNVNTQQLEADKAIQDYASGETDDVHNVVVSVAKADLAFRMVLEIRNRLIESYQEIMRMQI
ncbi:MAG: flagellar hook-basal body complex protein FliE [Pirellulaceae bacterium]|nr:flagellar hook-basal body complex protein FliE [Planctomycetales bacterium]MCA9266010.1 flagellar hook-basal body complex protein FliE [Planctomycetales bacterium]